MTNNDILRRLRYALDLPDIAIIEICRLGGQELNRPLIASLLKKEEEEGFKQCSDLIMMAFLDGLILKKRGRRENQTKPSPMETPAITNNIILKKLRIALELQEDDLLNILALTHTSITRAKLNALFRKEGHRNFKECGNQFLRSFLTGMALYFRDQPATGKTPPP